MSVKFVIFQYNLFSYLIITGKTLMFIKDGSLDKLI